MMAIGDDADEAFARRESAAPTMPGSRPVIGLIALCRWVNARAPGVERRARLRVARLRMAERDEHAARGKFADECRRRRDWARASASRRRNRRRAISSMSARVISRMKRGSCAPLRCDVEERAFEMHAEHGGIDRARLAHRRESRAA